MPILLTAALVLAQSFQFGLSAAGVMILLFQTNDQCLLFREAPLTVNYLALQLSQLIQKCVV
ncbi:hypothetical protein Q2941_49100 [Bradyrhizobium sp. UFLA05-153]